jgi:hypothetical protein
MQDRTFESYLRDRIDRALGVRLNKLAIRGQTRRSWAQMPSSLDRDFLLETKNALVFRACRVRLSFLTVRENALTT